MRAFTRQRNAFLFTLGLAGTLTAACKADLPTEATPGDLPDTDATNSSPGYTSTDLGVLAGDNQSGAMGVNDAGEVVGRSCCEPPRAIVALGGVLTALPGGDNANATAISNGTTRYIVGYLGVPYSPVRWSIAGGQASQPTYLAIGGATTGSAWGVNDVGDAVGNVGNDAAMWDATGNLTVVVPPQGFVTGRGRDINNSGDAAFTFSRPDAVWNLGGLGFSIGYLRLASGELIPLPPSAADGASQANSLTAVTNDLVTVAGTSYAVPYPSSPRATRWTVNLVSKTVISTEVRSEASYGYAISDGGIVAGYLEGGKQAPFRWLGSVLLQLNPPKGANQAVAWAISPNGLSVAGEAQLPTYPRAILWTFPSP
jgi:hypothetical protein